MKHTPERILTFAVTSALLSATGCPGAKQVPAEGMQTNPGPVTTSTNPGDRRPG